jgi:hypothetical protein
MLSRARQLEVTNRLQRQQSHLVVFYYPAAFLATMGVLRLQIATACTRQQKVELHGRVLNLHGDVLLMMHWSMLAYTGLVKIMKKYHKRTGKLLDAPGMSDLLSHPFCSTEVRRCSPCLRAQRHTAAVRQRRAARLSTAMRMQPCTCCLLSHVTSKH